MAQPRGIAVGDASGDSNTVYVAETAGEPDLDVGRRGAHVGAYSRRRATAPRISRPWGVTWDPSRTWLYVGDVANQRIVRMSPDGVTCQVVTRGLDVPEGKLRGSNFVEFDAQGRMYASDNNRRIYRFVLNG